jgi:diguanylate cyclase
LADIDHFKSFNDTHGHQAGDEVLCRVAQSLKQSMREVDIVCRYGGEEFVVIMPATNLGGAVVAAQRALLVVRETIIEFAGKSLSVTFSGGLAAAIPGESAERLVSRADSALYASKNAGRNCVHSHDAITCSLAETAAIQPFTAKLLPIVAENIFLDDGQGATSASLSQMTEPPMAAPNLDQFVQQLSQAISGHKRTGSEVSVIVGQVDRFRAGEDLNRAAFVDVALRSAMQFMRAATEQSEAVTRIGEDRFAVVSTAVRPTQAFNFSERVRMAITRCRVNLPECSDFAFTVSFGISVATSHDDADSCFARCLAALELATSAGGNQTRVAEPEASAS